MIQSVTGKPKVFPIRVSINDIRSLVQNMQPLIPNDRRPTVNINYKDRSFRAQGIEELRPLDTLPNKVTGFSVLMSQDGKKFHLFARRSSLDCDIEGPDDDWCVRVKHAAETFFMKHRRWFWWVRTYRVGLILGITYWVATIALPTLKIIVIPPTNIGTAASLSLLILGILLLVGWNKLFPWSVLIVREEESWLKRNREDIRTIAAIIAAAGALLFYMATVLSKIAS